MSNQSDLSHLCLSCFAKQDDIKHRFADCLTPDLKYKKLIEIGRSSPPLAPEFKVPENLVSGCQSTMYLRAYLDNAGKILFEAESEALISSGLAALLIAVYSGERPEAVLKCPPSFLDELGIKDALTPGRSNGLASMLLRMKQEALKLIIQRSN
jgi:cysteine desulfuration protein SufE